MPKFSKLRPNLTETDNGKDFVDKSSNDFFGNEKFKRYSPCSQRYSQKVRYLMRDLLHLLEINWKKWFLKKEMPVGEMKQIQT